MRKGVIEMGYAFFVSESIISGSRDKVTGVKPLGQLKKQRSLRHAVMYGVFPIYERILLTADYSIKIYYSELLSKSCAAQNNN